MSECSTLITSSCSHFITGVLYMFQSLNHVHSGTQKADWNSEVQLKLWHFVYFFFSLFRPLLCGLPKRDRICEGQICEGLLHLH